MTKRILLFFLALAVMLANVKTIAVCAEEITGSGTGDDGPSATQKIKGGPHHTKTGWLIYFIDWYGNQTTKTQVIYETRTPSECNCFNATTKFGGRIDFLDYEIGSPWKFPPFNSNASSNGDKLKAWLMQKKDGVYNCYLLIDKYFPSTKLMENFQKGENLLIIEPIFWAQMYSDDIGATGTYLCATANGWAHEQDRRKIGEYGSKAIGKYTNNIFPNCVKLEHALYLNKGGAQ